jgi:predicted ATP-dependent protease
VGGINEKIEGFFDICAARGLSGEHGVLIPRANVCHLMLRQDVVDAVRAGRFMVWAVADVDEALELLTGLAAGTPDAAGTMPEDTLNGRALEGLKKLAQLRRAFDHHREDAPARDNADEGMDQKAMATPKWRRRLRS